MTKRFILNADDFGMSDAYNRAVLEAYPDGILKSASLVANGKAFDYAINHIIPQCPNLGIGIHLNIIEGESIGKDLNGFKKQGLAIIVVALCTFAGTYLGSAIIAQIVLKATGAI